MRKFKFIIVVLALSASVTIGKGQTIAEVNKLNDKYQACMTEGADVVNCATIFHKQLDEILISTYKKLFKTFNSTDKKLFKADQDEWLKDKTEFYKNLDYTYTRKIEMKEWEPVMQSMILDEKSRFLRARIFTLVKTAHKFE